MRDATPGGEAGKAERTNDVAEQYAREPLAARSAFEQLELIVFKITQSAVRRFVG